MNQVKHACTVRPRLHMIFMIFSPPRRSTRRQPSKVVAHDAFKLYFLRVDLIDTIPSANIGSNWIPSMESMQYTRCLRREPSWRSRSEARLHYRMYKPSRSCFMWNEPKLWHAMENFSLQASRTTSKWISAKFASFGNCGHFSGIYDRKMEENGKSSRNLQPLCMHASFGHARPWNIFDKIWRWCEHGGSATQALSAEPDALWEQML